MISFWFYLLFGRPKPGIVSVVVRLKFVLYAEWPVVVLCRAEVWRGVPVLQQLCVTRAWERQLYNEYLKSFLSDYHLLA